MADFTDRIKLIFEAVTGDATKDIGKLKEGTKEASTGWGKLKDSAGEAIGKIASSPAAIAGAGAAIGVAAFKLAQGFGEAALAANDFATASGLSVEDASRWQEVAGDLGVDTATLEGAVNKLNIAASKGALEELGIGGETTNEQLLNAFEHLNGIDDASERASQGAKLFGKSWAQLAPLVEESANLRDNLASVSDQQVIDQKEVDQAKHFRDALDTLSDTLTRLQNAIGAALIEPMADAMQGMGNLIDTVDQLTTAVPGVGGALDILTSPLRNVTDGFSTLTDSSLSLTDRARGLGQTITGAIPGPLGSWAGGLFDVEDAEKKAEEATKAANEAALAQAEAAKEAEAALTALVTATLASFNSQLGLADAADATEKAFTEYATANATAAAAGYGSADANKAASAALNDAEQAALKQAAAADKLAKDQATANGTSYTAADSARVQADALRTLAGTLDPNSPLARALQGYIGQLDRIPPTKDTKVTADTSQAEGKIRGLGDLFDRTMDAIERTRRNVAAGIAASQGGGTGKGIAAPAGSNVVPLRAGIAVPGAPAAFAAPVARAAVPTIVVQNHITVQGDLMTNPAEVGRRVADVLDAFYRRSGTRGRVGA